jgi:hypothetical protein
MAKKQSKEPPQGVEVPIAWHYEGAPAVFANQMIVSADAHDVHLYFFEVAPPLLLGTDEEKKEQAEKLVAVNARCVIRVIINKERLADFAGALQATAAKIDELKGPVSNGKGQKGK